jgi:hypothetical protein
MIKSKFTFFQVQGKRRFADASKLIEPPFGDGPEVLNAVNMIGSVCKFIVSMFDPIVLFVTEVYQAVIGLKSIRIDHRVQIDLLPYNGHQGALRAISDNLRIHLATSFDQPENDMFTTGAATPDPTHSSGTKVAFVNLNFTGIKRTLLLAVFSNPYSNFIKNAINGLSGKTGQFSNFGRLNIQGKQLNKLPEFGLRNS